jgi:hypothetical protein
MITALGLHLDVAAAGGERERDEQREEASHSLSLGTGQPNG